jgi:hypothetical protein
MLPVFLLLFFFRKFRPFLSGKVYIKENKGRSADFSLFSGRSKIKGGYNLSPFTLVGRA